MTHPALQYLPTPNWAVLAWSLPYGWYVPPPPPDPSSLPPPGRYHLDPARSCIRMEIRRWGRRWVARTARVTGSLRFGAGAAAVDLAVEAAGLRTGDPALDEALHGLLDPPSFPLLRFAATELVAAHGAWLVAGQVGLCGRTVPAVLWLDPVDRLPDGTIAIGLRGVLERRASGLRRRVALELTLVAVPEPVSFAPPCVAGPRLSTCAA